jgi:hypothetical protein
MQKWLEKKSVKHCHGVIKKLTVEVERGKKRKGAAADTEIPAKMLSTIIKNKHLVLTSTEEKGLLSDTK